MSVELTGNVQEVFESRTTSCGFELTGAGALSTWAVEFGDGWGHPVPIHDAVGARLEHETGVLAQVAIRSGQRVRLEVTLESPLDEMVSVPGPWMRYDGTHNPIEWLAGASGEVVLPSEEGPGLLTQRRGLASAGPEPQSAYLFEPQPWLQPRQLLSSAWTYEAYPGDLLDLPPEQSWLPWDRYVPHGDAVEISMPDGMVRAPETVHVVETDGDFELVPRRGPSIVEVWTGAGKSQIEIGGFETVSVLREQFFAIEHQQKPVTLYLAARQLAEGWTDDEALDRLDRALGDELEHPTAWTACAASIAQSLGLPLAAEARAAATHVLAAPSVDDVILLALHGLAPAEVMAGGWPVGDFAAVGQAAVEALGYGRITSSPQPPRGRDVAVAKLYAAALEESEPGLRVSAYAQAAENRLLTHLSAQLNPTDLAWLSI